MTPMEGCDCVLDTGRKLATLAPFLAGEASDQRRLAWRKTVSSVVDFWASFRAAPEQCEWPVENLRWDE